MQTAGDNDLNYPDLDWIDLVPLPAFICDAGGCIRRLNPACRNLPSNEFQLGTDLNQLLQALHVRDQHGNRIQPKHFPPLAALAGELALPGQVIELQRPGQPRLHLHLQSQPLSGANRAPQGSLTLLEDRTELVQCRRRSEFFRHLRERLAGCSSLAQTIQAAAEVASVALDASAAKIELASPHPDRPGILLQYETVDGITREIPTDAAPPADPGILRSPAVLNPASPGALPVPSSDAGHAENAAVSAMQAPIARSSEHLGLITICAQPAVTFTEEDLDLLTELGQATGETAVRLQMEEALRESEQRYRAFVQNSSEGIYRLEFDPPIPLHLPAEELVELCYSRARIAECNDTTAQMHGFATADAMTGHSLEPFFDLAYPGNRELLLNLVRANFKLANAECRERDAAGNEKWFRNSVTGIIRNGLLEGLWGTQSDVTSERKLENQIRHVQKMEATTHMAGGVAHEFNNILTIIEGHASLMLLRAGDSSLQPHRESLQQIVLACERAAHLTKQLLAFSRRQFIHFRPLDLTEFVLGLAKTVHPILGANINLQLDCARALPGTKADAGMLEQVIINLAVNARDAMPDGGTLTLRTNSAHITPQQAQFHPEATPGPYVCLTAEDTGLGMAPDVMPRIFEPFFTTKEIGRGTGLGLAALYGIVRQHGGFIEVTSEPAHGSSFRIYLPGSSQTAAAPAASFPPDVKDLHGSETVLVVEDEPDLLSMVQAILEYHGYHVLTALNGREAEAIWQEQKDKIQVLVTDMVMPGGLGGLELSRRFTRDKPNLKVIYNTGYSPEAVGSDLSLVEGVNFLQKPYDPSKLARAIRSSLSS